MGQDGTWPQEPLWILYVLRKALDLGLTERVRLAIDGSERARRVAAAMRPELETEALAVEVAIGAAPFAGERREANVDEEDVIVVLARVIGG